MYSFNSSSLKKEINSKKWEDWPQENEYQKIESIFFNINSGDEDDVKNWPDFLSKLSNLDYLGLPIDMFQKVVAEIPRNIKSLRLFPPVGNANIIYKWPKLILEKLNYISIPELVQLYKISPDYFPNIQWLEYDFNADKKGETLKSMPSFKQLTNLSFSHAKNLDVFTPFENSNITTLELFACIGNKFPIGNIQKMTNLVFLGINNLSIELNFKIFENLEELGRTGFTKCEKN